MRKVVLVILLVAALAPLVPAAGAQPCEVPGCQVLPAALCAIGAAPGYAADPKDPEPIVDCLRAPA